MPKVLWRIHPKILVGGVFDFNYTSASEVSPGMEGDPYYGEFGPDNQNAGGGIIFQYDTRDIAANAWQGVFFNAQAVFYGPFLGSDNKYQVYDVEYRQYQQMGRPGKTLAWTGRTRLAYGAVPWAELSQLGSSTDLRGYRQGRYRDKAMLYGILEYRHQFLNVKRSSGMSRHGLVSWVGVGSVGDDFTELNQWLPNWGVGYRFEVQPRMSVRADVGFGREFLESGNKFVPSVYFSFTEAF
jgi:outer membrane protein assembly factor BamA